jgi:hypothetical protein
MIAEQGFGARRDIFEAYLPLAADQMIGNAPHVTGRLLGKAGQRRALGLRFDDAAQYAVDEQRIIDGARGCSELARGRG